MSDALWMVVELIEQGRKESKEKDLKWEGVRNKLTAKLDEARKEIKRLSRKTTSLEAENRKLRNLLCEVSNRFQDEDWVGEVPGINVEVVGFLRPYYDQHMELLQDAIRRLT